MNLEKNEELKISKTKKKPNKGPYLLGEALGEGAFAKVRLATQIHIKEKCAIKIVDKRLLEDTKDIQRLKKEIKILKSIRHKNIIQLFDIMESKTNLYFVIEYCKGGELFDYIVKNRRLKEPEACVFFQQIINGVEYLHKQGIIHRDLKPENLLLDYNNNIKISDFGLSTFFSKNHFLQTACGTPSYAPPEMLEGLQYNGEASDIWSCGIILYAMLCGTLPFTESKEEIIVKKIKMHDYSIPKYLSKEAQDMLNHILKINPEERFTIEGIKAHPWFNIVKPHLIKGISLNEIRIPVDENILNMVKDFGFDKEECRNLLLNNKFCSLTSIYYLCLKKYVREGGKSISDLESDLYEEYINDPNNYINRDKDKDKGINNNKEIKNEKNKNKFISKNSNNIKIEKNKTKNNIKDKSKIKNGNNLEERKTKDINNKKINNENINNGNKKIINNKESIIGKTEIMNTTKYNNKTNKDKTNINININLNKKEHKNLTTKNNISISNPKNQKELTTYKNTKKIILTNNNNINSNNNSNSKQKNNNKCINNNILIQDKKPKIESEKNQPQQIIIKKNNKMNSPSNRKNVNLNNNELNNYKNFNTIIIKKKMVNKGQSTQPKKFINDKKSPKRYIETNNIKSNSLVNSFINKNKSLEHDINNNNLNININENGNENGNGDGNGHNKFDKNICIRDNKEKKQITLPNNEKYITHSNTITGNNINNKIILNIENVNDNKNDINNNNIIINGMNKIKTKDKEKERNNTNKGVFAIGVNLNKEEAINIISEQSKAKEAYHNYRNILREGNGDTRNKSSPFPVEQFGLDKDIDETKLMEGQKPLNVINYIAKKLVSSSFCGSFNFQYSSAKKYSTARRGSALTYNHLISNGNIFSNHESNPINEEIEYAKENSENINNENYNTNELRNKYEKSNGKIDSSYNENINDINFKNLVSILNQKFKKYLEQNNDEKNFNSLNNNSNNKKKVHFKNNTSYQNDIKMKSSQNKSYKNNIIKPKKKNSNNKEYEEDLYSNSFNNSKLKNELISSNNLDSYEYNINNMTSHYNKFLDISTNYDPGIDSRGGSSIERGDSLNKNELRNFSFSLDKKHKKRGEHNFKTEYNENNNYNVIKNTFSGSQNKFIKNINIIFENDELSQNNKKKIKNSKNVKNKYSPFLEKKVSINLTTTFNTLPKNEYKMKKNK